MANFPTKPTLSQGESPSLYERSQDDNAMRTDADGGYVFVRRRFTRAPRYEFKTGFIGIPHADKLIIEQFWKDHLTDTAFNYTDYINGGTFNVRFSKPVKFDYVGVGQTKLWDIKIEMEQV